eukprot:scpid68543/ scgid34473/ 
MAFHLRNHPSFNLNRGLQFIFVANCCGSHSARTLLIHSSTDTHGSESLEIHCIEREHGSKGKTREERHAAQEAKMDPRRSTLHTCAHSRYRECCIATVTTRLATVTTRMA